MKIFPMVHLNGTSREALRKQYGEAYRAVQEALRAFHECAPHGRDYYPLGPGSLEKAQAEYLEHLNELLRVREYLLVLREHVHEGDE